MEFMDFIIAIVAIAIGLVLEKKLYKPYLINENGFTLFIEDMKNKTGIEIYNNEGELLATEEVLSFIDR